MTSRLARSTMWDPVHAQFGNVGGRHRLLHSDDRRIKYMSVLIYHSTLKSVS